MAPPLESLRQQRAPRLPAVPKQMDISSPQRTSTAVFCETLGAAGAEQMFKGEGDQQL